MPARRYLYMAVTNDRFELPISPAMPIKEISEYLGRTRESVMSEAVYTRSGKPSFKRPGCKGYRVVSFIPGEDYND